MAVCVGLGDGVTTGVAVGVGVGVSVGVGVGDSVGVGVIVGVGDSVGVGVIVGVGAEVASEATSVMWSLVSADAGLIEPMIREMATRVPEIFAATLSRSILRVMSAPGQLLLSGQR